MTSPTLTESEWPGREVRDARIRLLCQRLVRYGFRYRRFKNHGMLFSSDGETMHAVHWSVPVGKDFNLWVADLKRLGWPLDPPETVTPRRESPHVETYADVEMTWTDREWRELQARSDVWWRRAAYGAESPALEPEPEPEPEVEETPQLNAYAAGLMERLASARTVRPDAQGNGRYTLAAARQMLKDGYGLDHVITRTGWGRLWLADLAERLATG